MTVVYGDGKVMGYIKDVTESYSEEIKKYVTNCPNCGAPMTNHKCIYCGTEDYGGR